MSVYEIITKKRDGHPLTETEINYLVSGFVDGRIPDYQMASFLMAVYFRGMTSQETVSLTRAMMESGDVIAPEQLGAITADKHSTGGVGDKVSIPLAPLVAAAGVRVPMMSGRGLGHTGGTLDKLESIPGFRVQLSLEEFYGILETVGAAMIGQTDRLVPADKKMYALRDVTATVESIPLIAASIMSKKLAAGPRALVLDVKSGRGAFMKKYEDAKRLAQTMIEIGASMGRHMAAVLTSMDQPVGFAIGNALEIVESIDCLRGGGPADLRQLVEVLGGHMLFMTHSAPSLQDGQSRISELIDNGQGLDVFRRMIEAQGGDPRVVDEPQLLPTAPHQTVLRANSPGYISKIDALEVGLSCVELGAGRQQISDCIDHRVGVNLHCRIGDQVEIGAPLMTIHHDKLAASLLNRFHQAIQISAEPPSPPALIYEMLTAAV